ncbi:MAG: hypothetical protein AB1772_12730 [Candidatus Zixiibacteriota bacterium]
MSSLKRPPVWLGLVLIVSAAWALDPEIDPVLRYYWEHARDAVPRFDPNVRGVSYEFTAKTYRHTVAKDGFIRKTDSITQNYFYSDGTLDSIRTVRGVAKRFKNLDLSAPAVFQKEYCLNLFPNDTGGPRLAIGMWSDSLSERQPEGLIVIDRYQYFPYSLYLYFPDRSGFSRFTRSFRFSVVDGYVFPDSVWEVATRLGIFFPESYRLETGITDIRVTKMAESTRP